eukprot:574613-Pelagomonas_calceolata.AAC.1
MELPDAAALHPIACGYMYKLIARVSPDFDEVRTKVLPPYIAHQFATMMEKAEISERWKVVKISPQSKEGAV